VTYRIWWLIAFVALGIGIAIELEAPSGAEAEAPAAAARAPDTVQPRAAALSGATRDVHLSHFARHGAG